MTFSRDLTPNSSSILVPGLLIVGLTLASCQPQSGNGAFAGHQAALSILESPAVAQPIASDLTKDLSGLIVKSSKLALAEDIPPVMRAALEKALSTEGYAIASAQDMEGEHTILKLSVVEVGEDLLLRVTTPNIRLSKVYRTRLEPESDGAGAEAMRAIHVAGPPALEIIDGAIAR